MSPNFLRVCLLFLLLVPIGVSQAGGVRLTAVSVQVLVLVSQGYAQRYPVAAPACSRI